MHVQALVLEGFQSIRERTRIPIAPLTVMFGPNSAGKSAVADAWEMLHAIASRDLRCWEMYTRWRHVPSKAAWEALQGVDAMSEPDSGFRLGIEIVDAKGTNAEDLTPEGVGDPNVRDAAAGATYGLEGRTVEIHFTGMGNGIALWVDEQPVFALEPATFARGIDYRLPDDADDGLNLPVHDPKWSDEVVSQLKMRFTVWRAHTINELLFGPSWDKRLEQVAALIFPATGVVRATPDRISVWNVWPSLDIETLAPGDRGPVQRNTYWGASDFLGFTARRLIMEFELYLSEEELNSRDDFIMSCEQDLNAMFLSFSFFVGHLFRLTLEAGAGLCRVHGDRSVVSSRDVARRIDRISNIEVKDIDTGIQALSQMAVLSNPVWTRSKGFPIEAFFGGMLEKEREKARDPLQQIDHWMSLLRESLGGIAFGHEIQEQRRVRRSSKGEPPTCFWVRWFPRTSSGLELEFEEVGSGISHVFQIVACLATTKRLFVEQPELHLHPAAQCDLGDVFVQAANRDHFALVETHSEHVLLRILRRVRETSQRNSVDRNLRFLPEQISVLYFDRQRDGTTKVVPLRVSRFGDFLDRWPKGFFEERYGELFDE